jgi:GT2 family glycosyltransferase
MNKITASIVLYNNTDILPTIESVLNSTIALDLYLIDNSPTNALETKLANYIVSNQVIYIYNNKNVGFGAAHNIAIRKIIETSAFHLVINPDIVFKPNVIATLFAYMESNINVGLVMPKVLYPDGEIQYLCKLLPTPVDLILRRFLPDKMMKNRTQLFELRFTGYDKEMEIPYLSGCFMFLRVDALKKVGLFDDRFFMYPEDIDLTRRIHQYYKTMFYPYVSIIHEHGQGSYKSLKLLWIHISNMVKYFNKWGWFFDVDRKRINKKVLSQLK